MQSRPKTMLLIEDVKIKEVPGDVAEIHKLLSDPCIRFDKGAIAEAIEVERQIVQGVQFVKEDGTRVCIGLAKM